MVEVDQIKGQTIVQTSCFCVWNLRGIENSSEMIDLKHNITNLIETP